MNKMRWLFWNLGIIPDRTTVILVAIGLAGLLAMIIFGILLAVTHNTLFEGLLLLALVPASILMPGGSKLTASWIFASKEERAHIEQERARLLLRSWSQAHSSEKNTSSQP